MKANRYNHRWKHSHDVALVNERSAIYHLSIEKEEDSLSILHFATDDFKGKYTTNHF